MMNATYFLRKLYRGAIHIFEGFLASLIVLSVMILVINSINGEGYEEKVQDSWLEIIAQNNEMINNTHIGKIMHVEDKTYINITAYQHIEIIFNGTFQVVDVNRSRYYPLVGVYVRKVNGSYVEVFPDCIGCDYDIVLLPVMNGKIEEVIFYDRENAYVVVK